MARAAVAPEVVPPVAWRAATPEPAETRWVRGLALRCAFAVAAWGGGGLVLADLGVYRAWRAFLLGALVWLVLVRIARPVLAAPGRADASARGAAAAAVVLAFVDAVWNAAHASTHVLSDSDPGVYTVTGRWIAKHGNLQVGIAGSPFARGPFDVRVPGFDVVAGGSRGEFQFAHLLPTMLAEAHAIGGNRVMFRAVPILGGVALLVLFVAASRVLRHPWLALGATAALAVAMPQVHFSRDAYSEIPTQILLFAAIALLCDRAVTRSPRVALAAGLLLGLIEAARIDGLAILVGVPIAAAVAWYRTPRTDRNALARSGAALLAGIAVGVAIGLDDLVRRSAPYWHSLHGDVARLAVALAISCGVLVGAVVFERPLRLVRFPDRAVGNAAAAVVVLAAVFAWFVRPALQSLDAVYSTLPVPGFHVPLHSLDARSFAWLAWYLGPITVALAVAGAALVARRGVARTAWVVVVAAALLLPEALLYLWRPSAVPQQLWVTRRLLPAAFPLVVLLAFGAVVVLRHPARGGAARRPLLRRIGAVLAVLAIAVPVGTLVGVREMSEQRGFADVVADACAIAGPHAAVVAIPEGTSTLPLMLPSPIRAFCDVPTARYSARTLDAARLVRAARAFRRSGRRLWVAAAHRQTITRLFPGARVQVTRRAVNHRALTVTTSHRPRGYRTESLALALAPVPCCG